MDAKANGTAGSAESLLLGRIDQELHSISEQQHALARRVAVLRKARTMLHVGCSTFEVNAMIAGEMRKEAPQKSWAAPARYDSELSSLMGTSSWTLEPTADGRGEQVDGSEFPTFTRS
jgi:hypothetical protein